LVLRLTPVTRGIGLGNQWRCYQCSVEEGGMDERRVTLRKMTAAEYHAATEHREAESVRVLGKFMPEELARERVRRGTAKFLPDGPDTAGHHLVMAENGSRGSVRIRGKRRAPPQGLVQVPWLWG